MKSFAYMLISNIVYFAGVVLGFTFLPEELDALKASGALIDGLAVSSIILSVLYALVYFGSVHLGVKIVGGKGNFNNNFKVVCYSFSPLNFAAVLGLIIMVAISMMNTAALFIALLLILPLFASIFYIFIIEITGISVTSEITKGRAFAAFMIKLFIYSAVTLVLVFGAVFLFFQ